MTAVIAIFTVMSGGLAAEELRIAVAANFSDALNALAPGFKKQYQHKFTAISGSTGKFYLQIRNGAPFDVFLAADAKHPRLLESAGFGIKNTRFHYATGKLVLWSPRGNFVDANGKVLQGQNFRSLAIANPDVAPYGQAAKEYLLAVGLWEKLQGRIVMGQDIGQTHHFVASGASEMGFVALSQISAGSSFIIPQDSYTPLTQEAILLKDTAAAREFMQFLRSPAAKKTIRTFGYTVP